MWINIRDGDYNIALAGKQAMMIALATLGALESASALVADGDAGLLLILGIMVAVQFKMFFTVATTALEAEAQVSVVSGAVLKDYIKKGIEYAQTALANNSLADMQALAAKYREFKGKAFGLLMSTKVSFYLMNHHTTSTSTWESYSRKYVDAVFLHGPQQVGGIAECCMDGGPISAPLAAAFAGHSASWKSTARWTSSSEGSTLSGSVSWSVPNRARLGTQSETIPSGSPLSKQRSCRCQALHRERIRGLCAIWSGGSCPAVPAMVCGHIQETHPLPYWGWVSHSRQDFSGSALPNRKERGMRCRAPRIPRNHNAQVKLDAHESFGWLPRRGLNLAVKLQAAKAQLAKVGAGQMGDMLS